MTQLKIKSKIDNVRLDILLSLLNSWGLEIEVISENMPQPASSALKKEGSALSQARGMWADYDIDIKCNRSQTRARRTKPASTI